MQLSLLDAIQEGARLRNAGIQQAKDTADKVVPGWSDRCFSLFLEWLSEKPSGYTFRMETFRVHCEVNELIEKPNHKRAYGFISVKAAKAGLITRIGYEPTTDPSSHRTPASSWLKN